MKDIRPIKIKNGLDSSFEVKCNLGIIKQCKWCGKAIRWAETENGKSIPISENTEGQFENHFISCK